MNVDNILLLYSEEKQNRLNEELKGFWKEDIWIINDAPVNQEKKTIHDYKVSFKCRSNNLKTEIKYACMYKFKNNEWVITYTLRLRNIKIIIKWIDDSGISVKSFMLKNLNEWEESLTNYLKENNMVRQYKKERIDASQNKKISIEVDPAVSVLRQIYRTIADVYDERTKYDREVWDLRELGIKIDKSRSGYKLNFSKITQSWLNKATKKFMAYNLTINSPSHCMYHIQGLNCFSAFIKDKHPQINPSEINREIMFNYLYYLHDIGLSKGTKQHYIINIRSFFEKCSQEYWLDITESRLIYSEDIPCRDKNVPRYIPLNVVLQLNQHLDSLPEVIMRMVLILQDCGMRVTELCNMPFDCTMKDDCEDYFLRYYQGKMKKEHSIPITKEISKVIIEQQKFIVSQKLQSYGLLFCSKNGEPIKQRHFNTILNKMAYDKEIRDDKGNLYRFKSHQFRHTVGTTMINNGVPQHIVQRYLGHESPEMTNHYAEIHDKTMKKAFEEYSKKTVNILGEIIEKESYVNNIDLQWLKKNILAQALPNGYCGLPAVLGTCPHANGCLTCDKFRTDISFLSRHKAQLNETNRILVESKKNNWLRQVEMNQRVKANLEEIITALEDKGVTHYDN
ncbi:tyrosine-type recombinase/integrase [Clostridium lacusfryxellense]|uniref:tyrosine-type recombinase/integrase n=1 Tax=Clostridium lacusfryxellense TaxID=205328 RepID=UPI001C0D097D|nr:tyrosine-type recombinase/integrase [Clostridium lacusfryxellense]MBU3114678.1 tyrosine-type recombinase/integrase [Clostridium lacusfryxellense]